HILNDCRRGIDPADGNLVSGERIPFLDAIHGLLGGRVEDLIKTNLLPVRIGVAGGTQRRAEISAALRRRRDDPNRIGYEGGLAELLKVKEEEGLVVTVVDLRNPDRPTQREAVIVLP